MTPIQEWTQARNDAIRDLKADGYSIRELAFVFDLAPSRVVAILGQEVSAAGCRKSRKANPFAISGPVTR